MVNSSIEESEATAASPKERSAGFTLLELVLAVAIAGLALIGLFQAASTGMFAVNSAARVDEAIDRAQSHLAAFGRTGVVVSSEIEGDDGGGYHWWVSARPIATKQTAVAEGRNAAITLFDVEVKISWQTWGRKKSVVLKTRRIGISPTE